VRYGGGIQFFLWLPLIELYGFKLIEGSEELAKSGVRVDFFLKMRNEK
jgi:hypothetical protein